MSATIPALIVTNPAKKFMFGKLKKKEVKRMAKKRKVSKRKKSPQGKKRSLSPLMIMPHNFGMMSTKGKKKVKKSKKKVRSSVMAKRKKSSKRSIRRFKNPFKGVSVKGTMKDTQRLVVDGALITGGFLGLSVIENFLPFNIKANDYLKLGVKLGVSVVAGMLLGKVINKDTAVKVASGMAVNVVLDAMNVFNLTRFLPVPQVNALPPAPAVAGAGRIVSGNSTTGLGVILNKASL